jgi:hypothetical protein
VLKLSETVRSTHGQDGAVILDIGKGNMFRLNAVGSHMFQLLEMGHSEIQIVEEIAREFSADRMTVTADLSEFLDHLQAHGLFQPEGLKFPNF